MSVRRLVVREVGSDLGQIDPDPAAGIPQVTAESPGIPLPDHGVIEDPCPLDSRLQMHAPVWQVPDREIFNVSSFAPLASAMNRGDDFSSNLRVLPHREEEGLHGRLSFAEAGLVATATADCPDVKMRQRQFPLRVSGRLPQQSWLRTARPVPWRP
jgi:hypothetical protein